MKSVLLLITVASAALESPNIVITLADDVGYGDVGFTMRNRNIAKTPMLNKLAASRSTWVLDNMHSEAACSPSRIAILTARSPMRDCVMGSPIPGQTLYGKHTETIVQLAKQLGYHTLFLGKYFPRSSSEGGNSMEWPSQLGFQDWTAIEGGTTYDYSCVCRDYRNASREGKCFLGHELARNVDRMANLCSARTGPNDSEAYPPRFTMETDVLSDKFHDWLQTVPPTAKIFAQVSFRSVHVPFVASPELRAECSKGVICNKQRAKGSIQLDYGGCVHSIDAAVGKIHASLHELRPHDANNTMFIFLSDNGPAPVSSAPSKHPLLQPGAGNAGGMRGTKGTLFEGLLRVPALMEWPQMIKTNRIVPSLISIMDLPATIAHAISQRDITNNGTNNQYDGMSLLPFIETDQPEFVRRQPLSICSFSNANDVANKVICKQVATFDVTGRWKLIGSRLNNTMVSSKVYDLSRGENRASRMKKPELINFSSVWLQQVLKEYQDQCVLL